MSFLKETNRSIKFFIIFLSVLTFFFSLYPPNAVGQIIALVLLYCGIKFDYLIKKSPYFVISILVVLVLNGLVRTVLNFQEVGWLRLVVSVIFAGYVIMNVVRLAKEQGVKKSHKS